jgi:hypothetical protein
VSLFCQAAGFKITWRTSEKEGINMAPSFIKNNRVLAHFTPRLGAAVSLIALSTLNYGFDNQGIATSQAMNAYKQQFGDYNPTTKSYAIPTYWTSLLNSLNFIGFAFGMFSIPLSSANDQTN